MRNRRRQRRKRKKEWGGPSGCRVKRFREASKTYIILCYSLAQNPQWLPDILVLKSKSLDSLHVLGGLALHISWTSLHTPLPLPHWATTMLKIFVCFTFSLHSGLWSDVTMEPFLATTPCYSLCSSTFFILLCQGGRNFPLPSYGLLAGPRIKLTWDKLTGESNNSLITRIHGRNPGELSNSPKWPKPSP